MTLFSSCIFRRVAGRNINILAHWKYQPGQTKIRISFISGTLAFLWQSMRKSDFFNPASHRRYLHGAAPKMGGTHTPGQWVELEERSRGKCSGLSHQTVPGSRDYPLVVRCVPQTTWLSWESLGWSRRHLEGWGLFWSPLSFSPCVKTSRF